MAFIDGQSLFKSRSDIAQELMDEFQSVIPDVHTGEDGVIRILAETMATVIESVFLSVQILNEDMFVNTSNLDALFKHGEEYGVYRKVGAKSTGSLRFSGTGGTVVPIGTEAGYDPQNGGDILYFTTTAAGTLPNPGIPGAPTIADSGVAGNPPAGTYEYVVTFVTNSGETEPGTETSPLVTSAARKINVSSIPLGGAGTIARKLYRQRNGTGFHYVAAIADNTTTTYQDDNAENLTAPEPLAESTAESVVVAASSEDFGSDYNVTANTIIVPTTVPDGITDVTNPAPFTGATDPELPEDFRLRLIDAVRNPRTGSASDLKFWAEEVEGVESATVISNDNLGTPTNGHVTVRISGPNGSVPPADVIQAVSDALTVQDIANIAIHVGTFTPVSTNVSVTITLQPNYLLADITTNIQVVISDYVNNLQVGETFRVNGVIAAVMAVTGVADVAVTSPASNQATGATSKRVAGTITVS